MKKIMILLIVMLIIINFGFIKSKAENDSINQISPYEKISWLAGKWEGQSFGGICQEIWEVEAGGAMTGTFKLIVNDKIAFYELMVLDLKKENPALILKHFNADMTGWEEKDKVISFDFISGDENELKLDGLTYHKIGNDSLRISILIKNADGTINQNNINCVKIE